MITCIGYVKTIIQKVLKAVTFVTAFLLNIGNEGFLFAMI